MVSMYARARSRVVIALLAFVAACAESVGPDGMQLDIALDKNVVSISDSVHLTLTLSNVSPAPIRVVPADAYGVCMHAFQAFDAQGRPVTPPSAFCIMAASLIAPAPVYLAPLERMTISDWWVVGQSHVDLQPLTPGVYRVRGAVGPAHSAERTVQIVAQ